MRRVYSASVTASQGSKAFSGQLGSEKAFGLVKRAFSSREPASTSLEMLYAPAVT
jgi:hypothetical protein